MFVQKLHNAILYAEELFSEENSKKLEELHTKEVDSHMQKHHSIETQTPAFHRSTMFVQKLHNAILYAEALFSEENSKKLEELHTKEVDSHMQNIVRALDAYRVAFGDDETKQQPLAEVMLAIIAHWNESTKIYSGPSFGGIPSVLGVMLLKYLQKLQGTSFVSATFVLKPATVVVLLMLAIKYNDDYSPDNPGFFHLLGSYAAMMSLSLKQSGMPFTAPRFADLEDVDYAFKGFRYPKGYCVFSKYLSKNDQQDFQNEKQKSGPESAIMLYTALINNAPMKNIHRKVALWALQTLELEVLAALDWKLETLAPVDSHKEDQFWSLQDHAKHVDFWFWKQLAQINADASAKRPNLDPVTPGSDVSNKPPKTDA
jgi:hypothetical protein